MNIDGTIGVMEGTVKAQPKRRYDASRRRAAAGETRKRIVEAARQIFLRQGYAATRMAEIADAAGVSLETLYAAFGPKPRLVQHLIELAISGADQPVPALERAWVRAIYAEPDPKRKIEMFAAGVRELQERVAPLWTVVLEAAKGDSELKVIVDELNQRRVMHMRMFVSDLVAAGGLRPGLAPDEAADVIWAMNSSEFFTLLVLERGWEPERFETWIAEAWKRILLP
jgi:AcrR family transcriptional regulator